VKWTRHSSDCSRTSTAIADSHAECFISELYLANVETGFVGQHQMFLVSVDKLDTEGGTDCKLMTLYVAAI